MSVCFSVARVLLLLGTLLAASCSDAGSPSSEANLACSGYTNERGGGAGYLRCLQLYQ